MRFDPQEAEELAADLGKCAPDYYRPDAIPGAAAMLRAAIERVRELEAQNKVALDLWEQREAFLLSRLAAAEKAVEAAKVWADWEGDRSGNSGQALMDALQEYDALQIRPGTP